MIPNPAPQPSARGPLFGCLLGLVGLVFFGALIAWSLWQGSGQSKAIDLFTVAEPVVQPVEHLPDAPAAALGARLQSFAAALDSGDRAEASADAAELNHLIATDPLLADLRGQLFVRSIGGGEVVCSICYPLNGLPWENRKRYLVGTLKLKPELTDGHPAFRVTTLEVPGKSIPPWFLKQFAVYHLLERYQKDPVFLRRIQQLSALAAENDQVVIRSKAWKATR